MISHITIMHIVIISRDVWVHKMSDLIVHPLRKQQQFFLQLSEELQENIRINYLQSNSLDNNRMAMADELVRASCLSTDGITFVANFI